MVVSHTEKGRKICDKVKISLDPEVIDKYLSQEICKSHDWDVVRKCSVWCCDIDDILKKKSEKINIGLIIEIKIPSLDGYKKEMLENEEETQFHSMIDWNKEKYKVIDRRHLGKILEEQKLSSSGITDNETIKLGKILNLDIIILRMIYEQSKITKVLKVDTGEVLLFRSYETKTSKTEEGWIPWAKTKDDNTYFYKISMSNISSMIVKVWIMIEYSKVGKDELIKSRKDNNLSIDGWGKVDYTKCFLEMDCVNNTVKEIKSVDYDNKGKILDDYDNPTPKIEHVIPGSVYESLLKKVCK